MKKPSVFFIACFLLAAADSQAYQFDSLRWVHQRDSAWKELTSYDYYGWAFQWDSLFLVRWTSWTCNDIHDREEGRRAKEETRLRKKHDEDDAAFPEYTKAKKHKNEKALTAHR